MLQAQGVSVFRHGKKLIDSVSLMVAPGQLTVMVGPNGAGKSTLLKAFANEYKVDSGTITLDGVSLKVMSPLQQAKRRAILPQSSQLGFPFSVPEVVAMGRSRFHRLLGSRNTQVIEQAMQLAQVQHLTDRTFTTLSGGERQRVQLARVLAQIWPENTNEPQSRYLLLDEPTSALDLPHQHHVLTIARQLVDEIGMGVLVVLHDLNLAAMYADSVAIMQNGQIVCESGPRDALSEANIERVFGVKVNVIPHPHLSCPLIINHQYSLPTEGMVAYP